MRSGQLLVFIPRNFNYGEDCNIVHGQPELIKRKYGKYSQVGHISNLVERRYYVTTYGEILQLIVVYTLY